MKNTVQIFGLPKSATNFMEWTILNNFVDVVYKNIYLTWHAYKHSTPTLDYSEYSIIIYKEYPIWEKSMKRYFIHRPAPARRWKSTWRIAGLADLQDVWNHYYGPFINNLHDLPQDRIMLLNHRIVVNNYFEVVEEIHDKFNIKPVDSPVQPEYRLNFAGARASQTGRRYKKEY
jgi:hypothetical protein